MAAPKLHLDADTSGKLLWRTLCGRGYDVSGMPNEWMALDASDEVQLLGATAQGRVIFLIMSVISLSSRSVIHSMGESSYPHSDLFRLHCKH